MYITSTVELKIASQIRDRLSLIVNLFTKYPITLLIQKCSCLGNDICVLLPLLCHLEHAFTTCI